MNEAEVERVARWQTHNNVHIKPCTGMYNQVAMEWPDTRVISFPLNDDISRLIRRPWAKLLPISALGVIRVGYDAVPLANTFSKYPEVGFTMEVHVVHNWKII